MNVAVILLWVWWVLNVIGVMRTIYKTIESKNATEAVYQTALGILILGIYAWAIQHA